MTEQVEETPEKTTGDVPLELEIEFTFAHASDGSEIKRTMWVRRPSPEKLLVWQRTVDRLTNVPINASWTGSEVMAALERLRTIVDSLLVNKTDVAWIDDQFLIDALDFRTLTPFINQTALAFQQAVAESGNRQERRAAKKTRKKAPR